MPLIQRALLVLGALVVLFLIAAKVRKKKILMKDALFWISAAAVFVVLALIPKIIIFTAGFFGFISPSNFIFLIVIALLLYKVFILSSELSQLHFKLNELAQKHALLKKDLEEHSHD